MGPPCQKEIWTSQLVFEPLRKTEFLGSPGDAEWRISITSGRETWGRGEESWSPVHRGTAGERGRAGAALSFPALAPGQGQGGPEGKGGRDRMGPITAGQAEEGKNAHPGEFAKRKENKKNTLKVHQVSEKQPFLSPGLSQFI